MPPQIAATRRYSTRRAELGQSTPRRFTPRARHRFDVARRRAYLGQLSGEPTPWQAATIGSLVAIEWAALAGEALIGDQVAAREAREHRRLFQRLLNDFERTIIAAAAPPEDPLAALHRHLAERREAVG